MKVLIIGLMMLSCFVLVGCTNPNDFEPVGSAVSEPLSGISIFKEYYINYSIRDVSPAKCRWFNRDDMSYGSINFSRNNILINGEQTISSSDVVGGTSINYVKHFARDENFFSYNSINDYALERFVDSCNYDGILYMDAFVCQTANNNSTACYNLSEVCNLRLWTDSSFDSRYVTDWSRNALDFEIKACIRNFDMVKNEG